MNKNNLKNRFKQSIEKKKVDKVNLVDTPKILENIEFNSNYVYTDDHELNDFLNESSDKIKKMQMVASIVLGEIFEEVKNKLGNHYHGLYEKWLELSGYNRMTALRHRNRYKLFKSCNTNKGKLTIAELPIKLIQYICGLESEYIKDIIIKIDSGIDKKEISNIITIEYEVDKKNDITILKDFNYKKIKKIKTYEDLEVYKEKYEKLQESLKEINSLLKEKEKELQKKG
ncbi:hypothetical protein NRK67_16675 (plasmid) [Fusobacteria bacterium ZRK30]|nr:hypothetical protein NRK67_16675 [Fusobacteria bacterium ZRK30]